MTQTNNTAVSNVPNSMYNRGQGIEQKVSVMDLIHTIKTYNAAPGQQADPNKAGQFLIKNWRTDGKFELMGFEFTANILKIVKAMNWAFNLLDEQGLPIKDANGETKRGFAFTEEYFRFSRNDSEIIFKNKATNQITKQSIGTLKTLFKTPNINGVKNPFHKIAIKQDSTPYDSTFITEKFLVYGVFSDGPYAWEYFRMYVSSAAFGSRWDFKTKETTITPDSIADAIEKGMSLFNDMKVTQGIDGRFDDSHIVAKFSNKHGGMAYAPSLTDVSLCRVDNTEEYDYIEALIAEYKRDEFGVDTWNYAKLPVDEGQSTAGQIAANTQVAQTPAPVEVPTQVAQAPVPVQQPTRTPVEQVTPTPVAQAKVEPQSSDDNEGISISDIPF